MARKCLSLKGIFKGRTRFPPKPKGRGFHREYFMKYPPYTFVKVIDNQLDIIFDGIVECTFPYKNKDDHDKVYSVYMVENGKVTCTIFWYMEESLTPLPVQDKQKAIDMVKKYRHIVAE